MIIQVGIGITLLSPDTPIEEKVESWYLLGTHTSRDDGGNRFVPTVRENIFCEDLFPPFTFLGLFRHLFLLRALFSKFHGVAPYVESMT